MKYNTPPTGVHNHGPQEGRGIYCSEFIIGACKLYENKRVDNLILALEQIAGMDYRGNRSVESNIAWEALRRDTND